VGPVYSMRKTNTAVEKINKKSYSNDLNVEGTTILKVVLRYMGCDYYNWAEITRIRLEQGTFMMTMLITDFVTRNFL
jgi:hypothetical protein